MASRKNSKEPGDIRRIIRQHIFAEMEIAAGETVLGEALDKRRLHSVKSLASETGLDPRTLRRVLAAQGLVPVETAGAGHHIFGAEAGRQVAAGILRSTKRKSLPKVLNCTRPQAEQLVDEGMLDPIADGRRQAAGRTWKAINNQDIERFLAALQNSARPVGKARVGMVPIAKAAEKAKLSCIEIVHLVLGAFLHNVARLEDIEGYAAILVDPAEIRICKIRLLPGVPASEAFARLKLPKSTGWQLVHRTYGPRLRSITIEGPNGLHRFYRFSEDQVAAFASDFTTEVCVANENGIEKKGVVNRLKRNGVLPALSKVDIGLDLYRTADIPSFAPAKYPRPVVPTFSKHKRSALRGGLFYLRESNPRPISSRT